MPPELTAGFERAALELAATAAAVGSRGNPLEWCTSHWSAAARRAEALSPQAFAEHLLAQIAGCRRDGDGRTICELATDNATRLRLLATPLDDHRWLMVVQDESPADANPRPTLDVVTGLPDRAALEWRLAERFARPEPFALLFIDLDGFKQINDARGHLVGDRALREAAQRMRDSIREHDFIARFGGDEFVAIIEGVESSSALAPLLDRLKSSLAPPLAFASNPLRVSASIGAALSTDRYPSSEAMLQAADSRMYASRRPTPSRAR